MIHFHRWSVWSLPVRVGQTFAEQYRCCTRCGKSDSRTIDCAGSLKEVHDALRSVIKSPSDKVHVDLPTTREITRSILRSETWQKLYGADPEPNFSHPGASIRPEVCSHCSMLMEPKFYQTTNFTGWVWFCPTCQK